MNIIRWCNENNGFLTAILSLIGLVLSVTAIVVSIRTARLPYKKKLMLAANSLRGGMTHSTPFCWVPVHPVSISIMVTPA